MQDLQFPSTTPRPSAALQSLFIADTTPDVRYPVARERVSASSLLPPLPLSARLPERPPLPRRQAATSEVLAALGLTIAMPSHHPAVVGLPALDPRVTEPAPAPRASAPADPVPPSTVKAERIALPRAEAATARSPVEDRIVKELKCYSQGEFQALCSKAQNRRVRALLERLWSQSTEL